MYTCTCVYISVGDLGMPCIRRMNGATLFGRLARAIVLVHSEDTCNLR